MLIIDPQATDEVMMRHCFALAAKSAEQGEYPYAAAIVRDGEIAAENTNKVGQDRDVTRHAELVAISLAQAALACTELSECTIFANMEPCAFCSYAVRETRIGKVVFAMHLPIMGGASHWNTLANRRLSDTMPGVSEEGHATLRRSSPVVWTYMRARGLLTEPSPQQAGGGFVHAATALGARGTAERLMRALRRNFFGRGRGARQKR